MKKCPYCDGEIPDEDTSCHYCGSEIENELSHISSKEPREPIWIRVLYKEAYKEVVRTRNFKSGVVQIAPFVIIFGLGVAALFFLGGDSSYAGVELAVTVIALFLWLLLKGPSYLKKVYNSIVLIAALIIFVDVFLPFDITQLDIPGKIFIIVFGVLFLVGYIGALKNFF